MIVTLVVLRLLEMKEIQKINNQILIWDGIKHCKFEFASNEINYFRIARECHLVLYRSAIEALRGTANLTIKRLNSKKEISCIYRLGYLPSYEIHKEKIEGCTKAWRFSRPKEAPLKEIDHTHNLTDQKDNDDLIDFLDALAMIQTDCFMQRFTFSKTQQISDADMKMLEWMHNKIRNEYEHFMPKFYILHIKDLLNSSYLALSLSKFLIFNSGNVIIMEGKESIQKDFENLLSVIREILNKFELSN